MEVREGQAEDEVEGKCAAQSASFGEIQRGRLWLVAVSAKITCQNHTAVFSLELESAVGED